MQKSIRASVHEDAIGKVTSFFNATVDDMVRELFQNARRSGATRIDVKTTPSTLEISDNGRGIEDPESLLAFGRSDWKDHEHETPAGMGLYSMANTVAVIESKTATDPTGWEVRLEPCHYRGEAAAMIKPGSARTTEGTTILVLADGPKNAAIGTAARYLPVPVWHNGEPVRQEVFATEENTVGTWKSDDLTILVREHRGLAHDHGYVEHAKTLKTSKVSSRINFHGHIVREDNLRMPAALGIERAWYAEIDVHDCPELQLVLPARKETVRNAFLDRLRERCERAIFETIARRSPTADLRYRTWKRGCEVLGREIEHGPIRLHEWQPVTAENWRDVDDGPDESREEARSGLIVPSELSGPEQVLLQHAAQRDGEAAGLELWRAERRYEGYAQYDAMRRVRGLRVVTTDEGGVKTEVSAPEAGVANGLVETIDLVVQTSEHDRSNPKSFAIRSDIGFANLHDDNLPHQVGIFLSADREIEREDVHVLVMTAYYVENENGEESDNTQRERFLDAIEEELDKLLLSPEEALRRRVASALFESVGRLVDAGTEVNIQWSPGGECRVEQRPAGAA